MRAKALPSSDPVLWWACALLAPPLAWAAAAHGYGIARDNPWLDVALLALAAVAEEVVFRGGLQALLLRGLSQQALGISAANLVTSLAFAAVHLWTHPPLAALGVLPVSLVLGAAYERSGGRLVPPIALHLYFNLLLYTAGALMAR
jgi:membrane protease YdiL (CAAX protease family)